MPWKLTVGSCTAKMPPPAGSLFLVRVAGEFPWRACRQAAVARDAGTIEAFTASKPRRRFVKRRRRTASRIRWRAFE